MQLLAEALEREPLKIEYYDKEEDSRYEGVTVYYETAELKPGMVYLIRSEDWKPEFAACRDCGFVIYGKIDLELIPEKTSSIQVLDSCSLFRVLEILQDLFRLFEEWNRNLQTALNDQRPLELILKASERVFRNPMFIHDNYFYVLAYSEHLKHYNIWETDTKTGRLVVRGMIRNDFQLDQEYLEGLSEKKTVLFSANQRGYQILYHNLYVEDRYAGRVLVDEVRNQIYPGDYDVMEYLAGFLQETIRVKGLSRGEDTGQLDHEIRQLLRGQKRENQNLLRMMGQKEWKKGDLYRCLKLVSNKTESYLVSNTAIVDRLHVLLPDCYTLLFEESAVVIINMTRMDTSIQEIVAGLAVFIRDHLMKLGISSEYRDFFLLPSAFAQAGIALEQGQRSGSMYWYHYFETYMIEYVRDTMTAEMPKELLVSDALNMLKRYDAENHTDLFHTLKVYLRQERNLLQTAKKLYIHRSTLSYRIERIQTITGADLNSDRERLKLLLSFALEEL